MFFSSNLPSSPNTYTCSFSLLPVSSRISQECLPISVAVFLYCKNKHSITVPQMLWNDWIYIHPFVGKKRSHSICAMQKLHPSFVFNKKWGIKRCDQSICLFLPFLLRSNYPDINVCFSYGCFHHFTHVYIFLKIHRTLLCVFKYGRRPITSIILKPIFRPVLCLWDRAISIPIDISVFSQYNISEIGMHLKSVMS